eukprot:COSAG02_NODE_3861_length_6130_cov_16.333112_7_plen_260_part_01
MTAKITCAARLTMRVLCCVVLCCVPKVGKREGTCCSNGNGAVFATSKYHLDKQVVAFGCNSFGQLGDGSTTNRNAPVEIGALGRDNAQIACGDRHSLVRKADGRIMAFGCNSDGQLGDGSTTKRNAPVEIAALGRDNAQIACGSSHSLVRKVDGGIMAFGYNPFGQLGDGSTTNRNAPVEIAALGRDNAQIACGYRHSLVRKADGRIVAFGDNSDGQLGDGSTTKRNTPVEIAALGRDNAQIACGGSHSLVRKADGGIVA